MNQPDTNYWLSLAAQWIQSKSQTQLNFPNYPFSQAMISIPSAPLPPRISNHDATVNDNLVEADMDLEDEPKDELSQIWSDWKNETRPPSENIQQQQQLPIVHSNNQTPRFPAAAAKHHNHTRTESRFTNVQIPSAPIISGESTRSSHHGDSNHHVDMLLDSEEEDETNSAIMEAQKRKKLPLWIREGLERLERVKAQQALRDEREREIQQDEENRKKIMDEAIKELEREKKFSKSKYDSESENEAAERDETPETERGITPPTTVQDEEDNYEKMMLLVRKTLTEILLEVTDEKIQEISKETLSRYPKKASSVTRTPLKISLGLGVYSSSSDEDSDGEKSEGAKSDVSEWEPESTLKERIRVKTIAFEQRANEIKERLAEIEEVEQEHFNKRRDEAREHSKRHDSDSDKSHKPKSRKIEGEEKYEQINSISGSFARQRDKKKTRFNDPKERTSTILMTHVGMLDMQPRPDNGSSSFGIAPPPPSITFSPKKEKSKKRYGSSSSSSSGSSCHKKHKKKHKKSSKHSKKSSKKRDRSRSRERDDRDKERRSRHSIESRSSVRSSESRRHRSSRSRSRSYAGLTRSRRY